ncbi:hypothetical protein [Brevundimonas sp.]|uniref:hypothetical protein n=1 Tax=Brevundimonas sp. TaxID=1871086 RepID=UPI002E0E9B22|nr:hypothetical protein [Brevundimonas sp.]
MTEKTELPEEEYGLTETALDIMHNHLVSKLEVLRAFLTTVFSEAAEAGLTKQDVMSAILRHHDIIGEPNIPSVELPDTAPELYAERANKAETPVEFLARVWGPFEGILHREDLIRLGEDRLIPSLQMFCHRRHLDAEAILPPSIKTKVDEIVAAWTPEEKLAAELWTYRQSNARRRAPK